MQALAAEAVNAAFTTLGDQVTYEPATEYPHTVTAIRTKAEEIAGMPFGSRAYTAGAIFEVRIAELNAEPVEGDKINSAEGDTFIVRSVSSPDVYALVRRLDCEPA